jgi:hypothetical protein
MFPADLQESVLADHADLYRRHPDGYPVLRITEGTLAIGSVTAAPFGLRRPVDTSRFQRLEDWLQGDWAASLG